MNLKNIIVIGLNIILILIVVTFIKNYSNTISHRNIFLIIGHYLVVTVIGLYLITILQKIIKK
jgi:hypothetical protein